MLVHILRDIGACFNVCHPRLAVMGRVDCACDKNSFNHALATLVQGQAVIFPTETVYGLGVSICHAKGPETLFQLKERDRGKPVSWLVGSPDDIDCYGVKVDSAIKALVHEFWPGPLTIIVKASTEVPAAFQSEQGTIGLRMPDNEIALSLIEYLGCPLATTSANISGQEASSSFANIDPVLLERVSCVLADAHDVGDSQKSGQASTVFDCSVFPPRILREGAYTLHDFEPFLQK